MPEDKTAWVRKKEMILNLRRRHHSVVPPDTSTMLLPITAETMNELNE